MRRDLSLGIAASVLLPVLGLLLSDYVLAAILVVVALALAVIYVLARRSSGAARGRERWRQDRLEERASREGERRAESRGEAAAPEAPAPAAGAPPTVGEERIPPPPPVPDEAPAEAGGGGFVFDLPEVGYGDPSPERPARYANVVLLGSEDGASVVARPGDHVFVEVDIGPLRRESVVWNALSGPFPDELLPRSDLHLYVLLSSAELAVGAGTLPDPGDEHTVEQPLLLPAAGAKAPARSEALRFWLRTPERLAPGGARARLSYLYRDTVVQSQRLDLFELEPAPGEEPGPRRLALIAATDFTLSERLGADLEEVPERPRVSVLANSNGPAVHELTVRSPSAGAAPAEASAFRLNQAAVAGLVGRLREELGDRAPRERRRSARDLERDLRALAPLGWQIFRELDLAGRRRIVDADPGAAISVTMPQDSGFTLPWNFVYEIPIDVPAEELRCCPVVAELAAGTARVDPATRSCPHDDGRSHAENLLCPFGFWGYRHSFELLVSARSPKSEISLGPSPRVVVAQTETGVDRRGLADHVDRLGASFARHRPAVELAEARTRAQVKEAIRDDLPFVYFLCHGTRTPSGATGLGVGAGQTIEPADIDAWVEAAHRRAEREIWTDPRPLVFINACESLAIEPEDLRGYLAVLVEVAQAVGVIGTEARVAQALAMEIGEIFFGRLLEPGASVEDALWEVKASLLGSANLTGLLYTAYCFADLRVGSETAVA